MLSRNEYIRIQACFVSSLKILVPNTCSKLQNKAAPMFP